MQIDHVVLWVEDPVRSLAFFEHVVGLTPIRAEEFSVKKAPFPSVRVSDSTIIDLMPRTMAPLVNAIPGAAGTAGHITNHVCLAMTGAEYEALEQRLAANGTPAGRHMQQQFGARGLAPRAFYFRDPDGNILEARHYEPTDSSTSS
ncbi:MAG: VOC family protein [Kofleriaceae bacterium]|nr:VOC family protein [Kofleriaceae bacterium]